VASDQVTANGIQTHGVPHPSPLPEGEGTAASRFHILPLGIDLTGHDGQPRPAGDPFTIGYFARLCPEKGLHLLVEAFVRFHAEYPRTRLRVGGYLGERDKLFFQHVRAQAASLGPAVEFVEHIDTHEQKVSFLKSLDVLSVPTTYREPKGLSILEAWANGVPVVQPSHGAFPELISATGGGLLFEPGDIGDLVAKWESLLSNPDQRSQLATTGRSRTRELFSSVAMAERSLQLFDSLTRQTETSQR
jgi:glycosyltransferase involved in cell wall biosynthesis